MSEITHLTCAHCGGDVAVSNRQVNNDDVFRVVETRVNRRFSQQNQPVQPGAVVDEPGDKAMVFFRCSCCKKEYRLATISIR